MKTVKHRRHRYFLPNTSQPAMLLGAQVVLAGLVLLAGIVLFLFADRDLTQSYWAAHLAIKNVKELLLPTIILADILILVLGGIALMFYTHRIAGPAYRLGVILREIAKGNMNQKVVFRQSDYLKELAADANQMLDYLRHQIGEMQEQIAIVQQGWEQANEGTLPSGTWESTREAIHRVQDCLGKFNNRGEP